MRATDVKAEAEVRGCVCCGHCACVGARCKMAAVGDGTGSTGSALQGLIRQFTAITGASESVGKHILEACGNNLEMAVTMYLDGGGIAEEPSTSTAGTSSRPPPQDEVRAPIPQKQEILVEPEPLFGVRQEQELRNGGPVDKKLTTLADLFRPPIDLMHKGSFETAKESGQLQNKWLMVNIQNVQDFACQCLNRDVWSNEAVKTIIREHFIFWQVYHDSEEGQRYVQFYQLSDFPYVSILDPRTGQKLVEWRNLDVNSFLEQVTGFLTEHGLLDGLSCSPPKKRLRSESLIDASEDSQLEAAIKASLQETHYESSSPENEDQSDEESEAEAFSDSEGFISINGSDDEREEESTTKKKQMPRKELSSKQTRVELTERTETGKGTSLEFSCKDRSEKIRSGADAETSTKQQEIEDATVYFDNSGPKASLMLRYPNGQREQIALPAQAKLLALVKHIQSKGYPNERFELVTNFPRRKLSHLDYEITLQDAGLCPQETVFVQERN
ncbi:UBX domain-containing protein 7 isoform X4 [Leucoraja erinacea]|uniref:UBX domain-containing protein 7 isoform X4 n=2 Tax=Rajidae TaxID=30475 RepID=UPI0024578F88|nr:UBX domain-containing protein 7 isoform X4 [Leucoraja erinacea]